MNRPWAGRSRCGGFKAAEPVADLVLLTIEPGAGFVSRLRDALARSPEAKRFVIHSSETGTPSRLVVEGQAGGFDISVVAVAVRDTCKEVIDGMIRRTVARDTLAELVGPWQMTREALAQAVRNAAGHESDITDLVALAEATGLRVRVLQAG